MGQSWGECRRSRAELPAAPAHEAPPSPPRARRAENVKVGEEQVSGPPAYQCSLVSPVGLTSQSGRQQTSQPRVKPVNLYCIEILECARCLSMFGHASVSE